MAKITYFYNTETCKYEQVEVSLKDILKNILLFLLVALILAIGLVYLYSKFFPHPEVALLESEKRDLKHDLAELNQEMNLLFKKSSEMEDRDQNIYRQITQTVDDKKLQFGFSSIFKSLNKDRKSLSKIEFGNIEKLYKDMEKLNKQLLSRSYSYESIYFNALRKEEMLASIPAIYPVPQDQCRYTSGFGYRWHPIYGRHKFHDGIDLAGPIGTPIYASGEGVVKVAKKSYRGYGNHVIIDHGFGYETKYAHMKKFIVKVGQKIKRGELIGYLGNSGSSTGPHLHYEVLVNSKKVNPVAFLSKDLTADQLHQYLDVVNDEEINE